jgi:hypothetical protein
MNASSHYLHEDRGLQRQQALVRGGTPRFRPESAVVLCSALSSLEHSGYETYEYHRARALPPAAASAIAARLLDGSPTRDNHRCPSRGDYLRSCDLCLILEVT